MLQKEFWRGFTKQIIEYFFNSSSSLSSCETRMQFKISLHTFKALKVPAAYLEELKDQCYYNILFPLLFIYV